MSPSNISVAENLPRGNAFAISLTWGVDALLGFSFASCCAWVVAEMAGQWWEMSLYASAFCIPVISAYRVWIRRDLANAIVPRLYHAAGASLLSESGQ